MDEKSQVLSVRNTGRRPVQLRFKEVAQEDGSMRMCKPWLSIKPDKAIILTGEVIIYLFITCNICIYTRSTCYTLDHIHVMLFIW